MIQTYRFHFSLNRGTGLGVLFLICLFSSCNLRKEMVYFQTELEDITPSQYTPTFKKDDLLCIKITADDPETAVPFNLSADPTERSTSTGDRKSTRLNSSHVAISNAVFCLKK